MFKIIPHNKNENLKYIEILYLIYQIGKIITIHSVGENVKKLALSSVVGGNTNSCKSYSGEFSSI